MKHLLILHLLVAMVFSQVPQAISFQALVKNSSGDLLGNTQIGVRISILQGALDGSAVFSETHSINTNSNGLLTLEIGGGTALNGELSTIDWKAGPYFLKTEMDLDGGTAYSLEATSQLLSVPYAMYASSTQHAISSDSSTYADTARYVSGEIQESQSLFDVLEINNSAENTAIVNVADPVNNQDAATKAYVDALEQKVEHLMEAIILSGSYYVSDGDGNSYPTIKIGDQVWLKENLRTTKYNDGSEIPKVTDKDEWAALTTPGFVWYGNDSVANAQDFGALYNFYTLDTNLNGGKNICPEGFHVPSHTDLYALTDFLGGIHGTAPQLKEVGDVYWSSSNTNSTNETGFSGRGAGWRDHNGNFLNRLSTTYLQSSTGSNGTHNWRRQLVSSSDDIGQSIGYANVGASVRCLKN